MFAILKLELKLHQCSHEFLNSTTVGHDWPIIACGYATKPTSQVPNHGVLQLLKQRIHMLQLDAHAPSQFGKAVRTKFRFLVRLQTEKQEARGPKNLIFAQLSFQPIGQKCTSCLPEHAFHSFFRNLYSVSSRRHYSQCSHAHKHLCGTQHHKSIRHGSER